jgi:adenosylmethionine-8-amino-7-oxononanoate aminotransferase
VTPVSHARTPAIAISAGQVGYGDRLLVAPPLVIDQAECDDLLTRLEAILADTARDLLAHFTRAGMPAAAWVA